jgi:fructokinase
LKNRLKTKNFQEKNKNFSEKFGSFKNNAYLCSRNLSLTVARATQNKKSMNKKSLFLALLAIASENADGFTVNAETLQPVKKGFAVALAETQNSFNNSGLLRVIDYQQRNADKVNAFGGWLDRETGLFYWDATVICEDLETAKELGRINGQKAVFDLENLQEIRL